MTNKELKRASYIYSKEEAGVILTETEQAFLDEHREEYLASDFHKKEGLSDEMAENFRKFYGLPEGTDMQKLAADAKRAVIRKKFVDKLKPEDVKTSI